MSQLTPAALISTIVEFEREFQIDPAQHKPGELQDYDVVRLARIRDLYAEAISLCMIKRRT